MLAQDGTQFFGVERLGDGASMHEFLYVLCGIADIANFKFSPSIPGLSVRAEAGARARPESIGGAVRNLRRAAATACTGP